MQGPNWGHAGPWETSGKLDFKSCVNDISKLRLNVFVFVLWTSSPAKHPEFETMGLSVNLKKAHHLPCVSRLFGL